MCVLITVTLILIMTMQLTNGNGCTNENATFLKTFGSRPSDIKLFTLLYKNTEIVGITAECLLRCKNDLMCTNVIVFYNNSECYQYRNNNDFYSFETRDFNLISDRNAVFYEKKCLSVPDNCSSKLWAIERVLNYTLVSNGLTLPGLYTELDCIQKCLDELGFACHSINFKLKIDNQNVIYSNVTQNMGVCHLNDANNRHSTPNAFRASTYGNDYIENQCLNISTGEHCFYEEYKNKIFPNTNIQFTVPSKEECQNKCDMNTLFNCYGFSLVPINTSLFMCLLHSDDIYLIGPNSLLTSYNSQYFERSKCLNLTVSCTDLDMYIKYTPDRKFGGRIYMQGYSEVNECNKYGGNDNSTLILHIGILNRACGLTEALSSDLNRSLVYGYLIIQYNPLIQTQGDRLVKVGCLINKDDQFDNVTLDSTIHLNSSFPDQGEIIIANSTIKPVIRIMIVDPITNMDINEVQIGQEIQLRVQIEPADGPYDISPGKLWAIGENNSDSILLLDDVGCPVRPNIFPGFIKTQFPTKLLLTSNFLAFKFINSNTVKFKIMVHFCILKCPEVNCTLNRKIRNTDNDKVINGDENFNPSSNDTDAMIPIEYVIIVNQNFSSDRYYMEDGRIIIAGYDIGRNEVCLDYYLLLGLLILWFIIQLIIFVGCIMVVRKYKKLYDMTYIQPVSAMRDTQSRAESNCSCGTQRSNNSQRRLHWDDHLYIGPASSIYD